MADSVKRLTSDLSAPPVSNPEDLEETAAAPALGFPDLADGSSTRARAPAISIDDNEKTVISTRAPLADIPAVHATPSEMGRILVGERLGHFQLEEFVGGGGMGAVFRATDTMLGRTVAVKVLSRDQTDDDTLRRFQLEAQNAARLDSEHIARVYYVNEDKGWHYIVFEYIDGVNIRDLVVEQGPLSFDEAVFYTVQVAEALRHAARRDVVHRDIKPSNILVMPDGRAKLVDMGLARSHDVDAAQQDLTQSGVTLGTFDYISPEQAREPRNADVRSDIYSLGCTLYFMLTGRPPFPEGTVLQKLLSHSSDPPPDPRLFRSDIPDELCRLLQRMLAKSPAQRFQSPDDLIGELLRLADRLGLERSSASGATWSARPLVPQPWYEKHLPWAAPVAVLVIVILGIEWLNSSRAEPLMPSRPSLLPPLTAATPKKPGPLIPIARKPAKPPETPKEVEKPITDKTETPVEKPMETIKPMPEVGTETPAVAAPMSPRVLIVGQPKGAPAADSKLVATLAAAVELAAQRDSKVETIELHFDGERVEAPLDIALDALTIRAAAGRQPVLVFHPRGETLDDRRMLRIDGGRITFAGVQFRLDLPDQHAGEGWSLFGLTSIKSLELDRCALTIRNASESGALRQTDVAFLEFVPAAGTATESAEEPTVRPLVQISSTIARGEAAFVRSPHGEPFELRWSQGLLTTSERMIEIGGTTGEVLFGAQVLVKLDHLTIAAKRGLCLMTGREDAPKHLALEFRSDNCIFLGDPSVALIEHQTLKDLAYLKTKFPRFGGEGNIFAGQRDYWRIVPLRVEGVVQPAESISFAEADKFGFEQSTPLAAVMWKSLPAPSRPAHAHTTDDYLLSDDPINPALGHGFDATALPEFSLAPATPIVPLPMPATEAPLPPRIEPTMSEKMKMIMTPKPLPAPPPVTPVEDEADLD